MGGWLKFVEKICMHLESLAWKSCAPENDLKNGKNWCSVVKNGLKNKVGGWEPKVVEKICKSPNLGGGWVP